MKKKAGLRIEAGLSKVWRLEFYDIRCFRAFRAVNNVERHSLTFGQALKAAVLDV